MADKKAPTRSQKEIEAELSATRERLTRTVDELAFRVSPAELKRRQIVALKAKANDAAFTPTGEPRYDRLATGLIAVAGVAIVLGLARRVFHKG
ncbi:DUF3618 domain-containing protein [Ornithinimicrobium faecis]|uniref:DUF3618 domain-containing protein n=1 Tax=Ornithinimicrobium faecis TaxID=2934158 RepID=A0ABY4YR28_9MICO|nr:MULTISPECIES: DUF3618 domain-containing protein [unclassified Ornithinimicrobium]USQ79052.1 DUF3618 domain-containing protein [Ornithinimicrobium sp. HY1793]